MIAGLSAKTKIKTKNNIKRAILLKLMALIFCLNVIFKICQYGKNSIQFSTFQICRLPQL